jgi:hypothetical protein
MFDYGNVMLWDIDHSGMRSAIGNESAPVQKPTELLMNTLSDLFEGAMDRGFPTPHEKAVFDKLYDLTMPILRKELEEHFEIVSDEYPPIFEITPREEVSKT